MCPSTLKLDLDNSAVPNRAGESVKMTANRLKEPEQSNRDFLVSEVTGKEGQSLSFSSFFVF